MKKDRDFIVSRGKESFFTREGEYCFLPSTDVWMTQELQDCLWRVMDYIYSSHASDRNAGVLIGKESKILTCAINQFTPNYRTPFRISFFQDQRGDTEGPLVEDTRAREIVNFYLSCVVETLDILCHSE